MGRIHGGEGEGSLRGNQKLKEEGGGKMGGKL